MERKEFGDQFRFDVSEVDVHDAYLIVGLAHEQPCSIPAIVDAVFSHAEVAYGDLFQRHEFLVLLQPVVVIARTPSERVRPFGRIRLDLLEIFEQPSEDVVSFLVEILHVEAE